jgi:hypothetical protein
MQTGHTIPGFSERRRHHKARQRLITYRLLFFGGPLLALLAIDITGRFLFLVPFLLAFTLLDLRNQYNIWRKYVRHFGRPSWREMWEMWQLDSRRGYDAVHSQVTTAKRGHVLQTVSVMLVFGAIFVLLWYLSGWVTFLYPAAVLLMLSIKALVRRARPPAVLFLGASGPETSTFQLQIWQTIYPLEVISCLRHQKTAAPLYSEVLHFVSYRVGDEATWKEMVTPLMARSRLVVIDLRSVTGAVEYEIDLALSTRQPEQLFFVGAAMPQAGIPENLRYTEEAFIQLLNDRFHEPLKKSPKVRHNTFKDSKNHYFEFSPPVQWVQQDYDDLRTKVQFHHPSQSGVMIFLTVKETPNQDFPALYEENRRMAQKVNAMGGRGSIERGKFLGQPCSVVRASFPSKIISEFHIFYLDGLHFNLQYSAPNQAQFDRHYAEAMRSLNTITTAAHSVSPDRAQEQQIANKIRLAELMADQVSVDDARQVLAEAQLLYPHSKAIQDALDDLNKSG